MKRRDFIKVGSLAGGGLLISMAIPFRDLLFTNAPPVAFSPNAFLRIHDDGSIFVILSKVEMGQGIWTTLPMLLAEELDCDWSKIKVEHSPPGTSNDFLEPPVARSTGGSETTVSQFDVYRQAGATARMMLVNAAANRWGVKPEICKTENGYIKAGDRKISYGEVATDASALPKPSVVNLRDAKDWKHIGKSKKRLDGPEKINGKAKYGIDIHCYCFWFLRDSALKQCYAGIIFLFLGYRPGEFILYANDDPVFRINISGAIPLHHFTICFFACAFRQDDVVLSRQ